jgi:hypothetical protein
MNTTCNIKCISALALALQCACQCPPYCGSHPPPSACGEGLEPEVVYTKILEYPYSISKGLVCAPDDSTDSSGLSIGNVFYRVVIGCGTIDVMRTYSKETINPLGSDTGVVIDHDRPLSSVRSQALLTSINGELSVPTAGLAQGAPDTRLCFTRNVSDGWYDLGGDAELSGAFTANVEIYVPKTYCVPHASIRTTQILDAEKGSPLPKQNCKFNSPGGSGLSSGGFGVPSTALTGCANDMNQCKCDERCSASSSQVGFSDSLANAECTGFAWACYCACS